MNNAFAALLLIYGGTLGFSALVLGASGKLDLGTVIVFTGITIFYSYFGLARGFLSNFRLLLAYVASNLVQIIVLVLVIYVFNIRDTFTALLIYGTSYFLPLLVLQFLMPFPLRFRPGLIHWEAMRLLIVGAFPIILSHIFYTIFSLVDQVLLENYTDKATYGAYALNKTLTMIFAFLPTAINAGLMPRIARLPKEQHWPQLRKALVVAVGLGGLAYIGYAVLYNWGVTTFFSPEYVISPQIYLITGAAQFGLGIHSIISSVMVGSNRARIETLSSFSGVAACLAVGLLTIPTLKSQGAAYTVLAGAIASMSIYLFFLWRDRVERHEAQEPTVT